MKNTIKGFAVITSLAMAALAGNAMAQQTTGQAGAPTAGMMRRLPISIDGNFTFPMQENCSYVAQVRGTARPAGNNSSGTPVFNAEGVIAAGVECPNRAAIHAAEHLTTPQPMTLQDLEQAIEMRASLVREMNGMHCAYVPNFTLSRNSLQGVGAALMCPVSGQEQMRGGGPSM